MGRKKLSADANSSPIFWGPHPPDPTERGSGVVVGRGVGRKETEQGEAPPFFSTFPQSTRSPPPSHARLLPLHQPPTRRSWRNGENKGNFKKLNACRAGRRGAGEKGLQSWGDPAKCLCWVGLGYTGCWRCWGLGAEPPGVRGSGGHQELCTRQLGRMDEDVRGGEGFWARRQAQGGGGGGGRD